MRGKVAVLTVLVIATLGVGPTEVSAQDPPMGFFITSVGPGNGGDLGGLAGADAHCEALAVAVGAGGRAWRAYVSQNAGGGLPQVNARDRIGNGPWYNANGQIIAANVADLHGDRGGRIHDLSIGRVGHVDAYQSPEQDANFLLPLKTDSLIGLPVDTG